MPFYPNIIPMPFSENGDMREILTEQGDQLGRASWSTGFGPELSQRLPPNGRGSPVSRLDFNAILNAISQVAYYAQSGGIFQYSSVLEYQANRALVFHNGQLYFCVQDNGGTIAAVEPGTNASVWQPLLSFIQNQYPQIGNIVYRASTNIPGNMLICNGQAMNRVQYAGLFGDIGTTYGEGDGSTTFNLPDLRGVFIRGLDMGRGLDPNRALGSYQEDAQQNITGSLGNFNNYAAFLGTPEGSFYLQNFGPQIGIRSTTSTDNWIEILFDSSRQVRVADEVRVKNIALVPCIYYM